MVLLFGGTLGISAAFGMLLLLPLYVQKLGGDEADFGIVMASATVTAALAIGLVIRYPQALRANVVLALAVLSYGLGAAGAALVNDSWVPLVGIGLLLGTAWAVVYAASPMVMSEMVTDEERVTYFGYLTGTQQLGIGVGPVVAGFLVEGDLGFRGTFLVAGVLCALAAAPHTGGGHARTRHEEGGPRRRPDHLFPGFDGPHLALGECVLARDDPALRLFFTTLTSFQTTFARAQGLDFSVFYLSYTAAVILSRFGIANFAARYDTRLVVAVAVSLMALSVASFLFIGSNAVFYGLASGSVGFGYGLALPAAQAQAVNVSEESVRVAGTAAGRFAVRDHDPGISPAGGVGDLGFRLRGGVRAPDSPCACCKRGSAGSAT